jgi:hypothetical protein
MKLAEALEDIFGRSPVLEDVVAIGVIRSCHPEVEVEVHLYFHRNY